MLRLCFALFALTLLASGTLLAQNRVRTESIRRPLAASSPAIKFEADAHVASDLSAAPDISSDLALLPPAVARTRERILAAARTGDLQQLVTLMQASDPMPVFSFTEDKDPIAFWKASYPDSAGIEVLSILITILNRRSSCSASLPAATTRT
jgi:hypothetical protein